MQSFFSRISRPWRVVVHFVLAGFVLYGLGAWSWPDQLRGMRSANKHEEFFRYVAQQLDEPSLCTKIPWSVRSPSGFFLSPSYERSDCYDFIAGRTRNPWLCLKVRRLGLLSLLSEQTSVWSCLKHAIHGWNAGIGISPADLIGFFTEMGYDPDTLHLEGITPPVVSIKDIYRQLPNQPDILARIEKTSGPLENQSNASRNDSENAAYLADMAALVSKNYAWCLRIPEDLPLAGGKATFRDWCLFTLASNTKDLQLCARIPMPDDGTDPRMSLQAQCKRQVNSPYPSNTRYAPEVPTDDARSRALITTLNYEIPQANDLAPERIYAAYDQFLDELKRESDPAHVAARQRFIERVQRLGDNN
jgi:hypothetical protein